MIRWCDPQPWSDPAVLSLVPFVLKVLLKSEAVKVVTWLGHAELGCRQGEGVQGRAQLREERRVGAQLVGVQVESAEAREEDLPGQPELRGRDDHLGDHLHLAADASRWERWL